jgi:DnaJ-class molecular chaperone
LKPKTPELCLKREYKSISKLIKQQNVSYYDILEVSPGANEKIITKAYFRLAKFVHPDKNKEASASEDFQVLKDVYDILKNPSSRMAYNCKIKKNKQMKTNHEGTTTSKKNS